MNATLNLDVFILFETVNWYRLYIKLASIVSRIHIALISKFG